MRNRTKRIKNIKLRQFLATFLLSLSFLKVAAHSTEIDTLKTIIELEEVIVSSQHGEQRLLDIPAAITVVGVQTLRNNNITELEQLAAFVPGLNVLVQNPNRPNLVIRGLTSDEVSPTAQPRVSVYFDHAPTSRASMALSELYDIERVEVLKGPQGTLFGRGSQAGAISFITRKPDPVFGGYAKIGVGNYGMKHIEGALNVPIMDNVLSTRIAGIYTYRDGYVKNLSGGKALNDKNTAGVRFSTSFTPKNSNFKADLTVNYQNDNNSGTAFVNPYGGRKPFDYEVFFDNDKQFYNKRNVFGTILNARYHINDNNYFSSITSYFNNTADSRFDADGTSAPALDMAELVKANQFTQEFRYNFALGNRFSGIAGTSFWRENVSQTYHFRPDEQYAAWLFFEMPTMLMPGNAMTALLPNDMLGELSGMLLPTNHEEKSMTEAVNSALDFFFDATYKLLPKMSVTAGIRTTFENFSIQNRAYNVNADVPSTLGMLIGMFVPNSPSPYPNFFFAEVENPTTQKSFSSLTWRANAKYDIADNASVYAGYSRGRRPNVLQYNSAGELSIIDAETLHSFDAGYRMIRYRYRLDVSLFCQLYRNFQSSAWEGMNYLILDIDKATAYGAEISGKVVINDYVDIFGNYNYIHATFDDKDRHGNPQGNAGNTFRLTPRNSFLVGFNAGVDISQNIRISLTPAYSWKSHFWFEDANDEGIDQNAYGLLNVNLASHLKKQRLTFSVFGTNLMGEKYLIGAGNMGAMFGVPTFVPGAPRMFGGKVTWRF
ncbi:MAG: TonB-dependent receptor [Bacteroidales bacterium]|nr:TonB-dependent receptor [Bacteroidales bacterium]